MNIFPHYIGTSISLTDKMFANKYTVAKKESFNRMHLKICPNEFSIGHVHFYVDKKESIQTGRAKS